MMGWKWANSSGSGGGACVRCAIITAMGVSPLKGVRPVSSS